MGESESAARLIVRGKVQMVGYRMWTVAQAERRGLRGWVRNRADGAVEILAIGPTATIDDLAEHCKRGPRLAEVSAVERHRANDDGSGGFEQRDTV